MNFSDKETKAIFQCFWQLFGARPSQKEISFVESLISDWYENPSDWVVIAIQQNPYISFKIVSQMSIENRTAFKEMIIRIAESEGDNDYKIRMAISLFKETNIPYAIVGREMIDVLSNTGNNANCRII